MTKGKLESSYAENLKRIGRTYAEQNEIIMTGERVRRELIARFDADPLHLEQRVAS